MGNKITYSCCRWIFPTNQPTGVCCLSSRGESLVIHRIKVEVIACSHCKTIIIRLGHMVRSQSCVADQPYVSMRPENTEQLFAVHWQTSPKLANGIPIGTIQSILCLLQRTCIYMYWLRHEIDTQILSSDISFWSCCKERKCIAWIPLMIRTRRGFIYSHTTCITFVEETAGCIKTISHIK